MLRNIIQAFCKTLAVLIAIGIGFVILTMGASFLPAAIEPYFQTATIAYRNANGEMKMTGPVTARINIHGVIGVGDLRIEKVQALLSATQEGIFKGRTKALFLHINSPGGGATDSNDIYNAIIEYKKKYNIPVIAYADGLCASGGMMIACAADKVLASEMSIIGSVGVILSPYFNFTQLMGKVGIQSETVSAGKGKRPFNPFGPWSANEGENLKHMTEVYYNQFVNLVANARPKLTEEKLRNDFGAHIFVTQEAIEHGYIDGRADTIYEALAHFEKEKMIPEGCSVIGPMLRKSPLDMLGAKGQAALTLRHEMKGISTIPPELQNRPCYLYLPQ